MLAAVKPHRSRVWMCVVMKAQISSILGIPTSTQQRPTEQKSSVGLFCSRRSLFWTYQQLLLSLLESFLFISAFKQLFSIKNTTFTLLSWSKCSKRSQSYADIALCLLNKSSGLPGFTNWRYTLMIYQSCLIGCAVNFALTLNEMLDVVEC